MKTIALACLLVALSPLAYSSPANALDQPLPPPRIKDNGDVRLREDMTIGRFQGGKFISAPDTVQIQGSGSTGDVSATEAASGTGTRRRPLQDRFADDPALVDYDAAAGGSWDSALAKAQSGSAKRIRVPSGDYLTTFGPFGAPGKVYAGAGQLAYTDGTKDAPWRTIVNTFKPNATGWDSGDPTTQWTGDFSQFHTAARSYVTSSANPPTSNTYTNMNMVAMTTFGMTTEAGFNTDPLDHAKGRTSQSMHIDTLRNKGQGDVGVWTFNAFLDSTRTGATHFLAAPQISAWGGNLSATPGSKGYIQGGELNFSDNGAPTAVFGYTWNYKRTNDATDIDQKWIHERVQSSGTKPIDAFASWGGPARRGMDVTSADFGAEKAAVILKPDDKIYFGGYAADDKIGLKTVATDLGQSYITQSPDGFLILNAGATKGHFSTLNGSLKFSVLSDRVTSSVPLRQNISTAVPVLEANQFTVYLKDPNTAVISWKPFEEGQRYFVLNGTTTRPQ